MWVSVSLCWTRLAHSWCRKQGKQSVTSICPQNPTRTVRSTFDLIPHSGATSFITWMWSVVIGEEVGGGWERGRGAVRTPKRGKGGSYVHVQKLQTERRCLVWCWLAVGLVVVVEEGRGMQRGQGVRADECFVILRRGLCEEGARCGGVVWIRDKLTPPYKLQRIQPVRLRLLHKCRGRDEKSDI